MDAAALLKGAEEFLFIPLTVHLFKCQNRWSVAILVLENVCEGQEHLSLHCCRPPVAF